MTRIVPNYSCGTASACYTELPFYAIALSYCTYSFTIHLLLKVYHSFSIATMTRIDFFQKRNKDILIHALKFLKKILFNFFLYWQIVDIITHVDSSFFVFS